MAALGRLVVSLGLDAAEFVGGLTKSEYQARRFARDVAGTLARGAAAFTAIAGAAGGALAVLGRAADQVAVYKGLSEQIGATAQDVAALRKAADISGTALDTVATASVRLTDALAKNGEEGKPVARALADIGIAVEDFKRQDPVTQLETIALQLAKYRDGAEKSAVATALFGRAGAQLIPFFNDLADAGGRTLRLTQEQIEAADQYTKAFARVKSELAEVAEVAIADLIPAATALASELGKVIREITGVDAEGRKLAGGNAIREFAEGAAVGLAIVVESAIGVGKAIRAIGGSFESVAADIAVLNEVAKFANPVTAVLAGDRDKLRAALENRRKVAAEANQRYVDLWNYDGTRISDAVRKAFRDAEAAAAAPGSRQDDRPRIRLSAAPRAGGGGSAAREQVSEAQRFLEALESQLRGLEDLTVAQQVAREATSGRLREATDAELRAAEALAVQIDAQREFADALRDSAAANSEWLAEQNRAIASAASAAQSAQEGNAALREEIEVILGGEEARRAIERARTSSAIATKEQSRAIRELNGATEAELALLDAEIEALRERNRLLGERNDAVDAMEEVNRRLYEQQELARGVAWAFGDAFEQAIMGGEKLSDVLKNLERALIQILIRQTVIKPFEDWLSSTITSSGAGQSGGGWFGALIGAFTSGGGKSNGGPTMPWSVYSVAEQRPEVYDDGSNQWLITGSRRGRIMPNPQMGGGTTINAPINITVPGNTDSRTAGQIGAEVSRQLMAVSARNN